MLVYTRTKSVKKAKKPKKELVDSWNKLLQKYPTKTISSRVAKTCEVTGVFRRETPHIASLNTSACDTFAKPSPVYTGDKVLGISTMHKSNAVPVFSQEQAVDISKMRRT